MGKLRILSGRDVCKILEQNGFVQIRQRGSHIMMQLQAEDYTITVPVPNYDELKDSTLRSIIRQSGLSRTLFEV